MTQAEELNQAAKLAAVERLWQGADDAAIANYACKLLSESLAAAESFAAAYAAAERAWQTERLFDYLEGRA